MENSLKYTIFKTKWGFFGILTDCKGLLATSLPTNSYESAKRNLLAGLSEKAVKKTSIHPHLRSSVTAYYKGDYVDFGKLKIEFNFENLTDFSKRILTTCSKLKIGQTVTYGQLAIMAGFPGAARAAGSVLAANKWPLLIGCHRVTRSDGIGRFSGTGGSLTKKMMIEHEKMLIN